MRRFIQGQRLLSARGMTSRSGSGPSVAIIGAGIIGLSCAWELAKRGAQVTIYEKNWPPRGASWAAAGMLAPAYEAAAEEGAHPQLFDLCMESAALWPAFAAELEAASGAEVGYCAGPSLAVAATGPSFQDLEITYYERWAGQTDCALIDADACREIEPSLSSQIRGGVRLDTDGWLDNRAALNALVSIVEASDGIDVVKGDAMLELRRKRRRVSAQRQQSAMRARSVRIGTTSQLHNFVLATTGWHRATADESSPSGVAAMILPRWFDIFDRRSALTLLDVGLAYEDGIALIDPVIGVVRPVKGQAVSVAAFDGMPDRVVRFDGGYIAPKADRLVIGATSEPDSSDVAVNDPDIDALLQNAVKVCPALAHQPILQTWAGVRPLSPDAAPLLGPTKIERLCVATGHYRNGILLAPITAQIMADMILEGCVSELAAAFSPQRFVPEAG